MAAAELLDRVGQRFSEDMLGSLVRRTWRRDGSSEDRSAADDGLVWTVLIGPTAWGHDDNPDKGIAEAKKEPAGRVDSSALLAMKGAGPEAVGGGRHPHRDRKEMKTEKPRK